VQGVRQGFVLQGCIKSVEDQLADGALRHCAQALMAWAVGNARIKLMGNAIMVTKQASGIAKIDPLMALFDAAFLMLGAPDADGGSIWDREDLSPSLGAETPLPREEGQG
jgi:phage terminase large subunit-like protein